MNLCGKKKITPLTITTSDLVGNFLLTVFMTLHSASLEVLVLEWGTLLSGSHKKHPTELQAQISPWAL